MMTKYKFFLVCCVTFGLAGCFIAPKTTGPQVSEAALDREQQLQHELVFEAEMAQKLRLFQVGTHVLNSSVDLCEKRTRRSGFYYVAQQDLDKKFYTVANQKWGLADFPKVIAVLEGSGAERSGLQPLDTIIGLHGSQESKGKAVLRDLRKFDPQSRSMRMSVLRNGNVHELEIARDPSCDYRVELAENSAINAFADGERIVIFSGLMDFARKDEELALVVAHELAHNTEGHVDAQQTNALGGALIGAVFDVLLGTGSTFSQTGRDIAALHYSVDFEREADYIGMYMLARSPYQIEDAGKFWRRMAVQSKGKGIEHSSTHPTSAERMLAISQTEAEIAAKRRNNQPLLPTRVE